jgi:hypothetical protein
VRIYSGADLQWCVFTVVRIYRGADLQWCGLAWTRLRPFLKNIFLENFLEKNNFLEKFSRNSRKKIEIQISFFYTFGILTTKMTTKVYTKLASIEINDEILSKVGGIWQIFGKNF